MKAVVFAYHTIGARAIRALRARGIEVALVVSHEDSPGEALWFESVDALCREAGIPCMKPERATDALNEIERIAPDFIFSFYYRQMLPTSLLQLAGLGAFNLHGSLLPKYRGRVPINWAVLHGETETGVTLHEMVERPDAGAIVAQTMVPILPDDTAHDVFRKLAVAAEQCLWKAVPELIQGSAPRLRNAIEAGSYFGKRTPEDGCIDWTQSAQTVYNLHRAVAPPYPGAFTEIAGERLIIGRARLSNRDFSGLHDLPLGLAVVDNRIFGLCGDRRAIDISELLLDNQALLPAALSRLIASSAAR